MANPEGTASSSMVEIAVVALNVIIHCIAPNSLGKGLGGRSVTGFGDTLQVFELGRSSPGI